MASLPEEMVEEILSWLPVESLVRFKCVCKSWFALFTNPKFVSLHMLNQSKEDLFLHRYCPDKGNIFHLVSEFGDGEDNLFGASNFTLNLGSKSSEEDDDNDDNHLRRLYMIGHCNGLVALSHFDEEEVILWNPGIREFRLLPDSCFHPLPRYVFNDHLESYQVSMNGIGFGYDPQTDDYKFVRIIDFKEDSHRNFRLCNKAEVFSLRGTSTWTEIDKVDVGANLFCGDDLEQFFDGVYYWQGREYTTKSLILVSFDMANEVFNRAPMPEFCNLDRSMPNRTLMTSLGVFNKESIALFVHPFHKFDTCIEVWVMKEFGLKESWTKKLTIGPLWELERALVFWKNDEELLHEDVNGCIVSYNLATMAHTNFPINGVVEGPNFWKAATYKKTLVSVNVVEDIADR